MPHSAYVQSSFGPSFGHSGSNPVSGTTRLDTVVDPGVDKIYQFFDQSDAIPQRIYPTFFSNGGPSSSPSTWSPHPVLRHSSGAVSFLPDHPHESECLAPAPVGGNFAGVEEWPTPVGGGARIGSEDALQGTTRFGTLSKLHLQQAELERRVAGGRGRRRRGQQLLGFGIAPTLAVGTRPNRDRARIGLIAQQLFGLVVVTKVERAKGGVRGRAALLGRRSGLRGEDEYADDEKNEDSRE